MVRYVSVPEMKFIIPKEAFRPAPKVDSAVIHIKTLASPSVVVIDEKIFFRLVKTAFSQRRKTLSNSLKGMDKDIRRILMEAGIDPSRRPETLSLEEFARLSDSLSER
jgi:16S rRNA (adenine1518-N6/adenine1519-N6)-dimethyltransferase